MNKKREHIDFYLIGLGNHAIPKLGVDAIELIAKYSIFSGGKRHYELVKKLLPKEHRWINITGGMTVLMDQYKDVNESIVVFASGDPFFYGFGNTLQRLFPEAKLMAMPYFSSIQLLCQKTQTNSNELKTVSVHGRDWSTLDNTLINGGDLIGVLTDREKSPAAISARMLQYGFDNYIIVVGEELDGENEKVEQLSLEDCSKKAHQSLNCVLLKRQFIKPKHFGIPDNEFVHLANRSNMITKMPIRLATIQALQLEATKTFWDIGTCTGSVAIEAKRHYPNLKTIAFEKREESRVIIQQNKERFSAPGIQVEIGDFFEYDLTEFPKPEVVFIGGHGNRLEEMLRIIHQLNPEARIVTNAVQESTTTTFVKVLNELKYKLNSTNIQIEEHNKIKIHTAEPVAVSIN